MDFVSVYIREQKRYTKKELVDKLVKKEYETSLVVEVADYLEEAGYIVSDCMNVIGRPDLIENAAEYDVAIIVENTTKSSTKHIAEENVVIKEYMNNGLCITLV